MISWRKESLISPDTIVLETLLLKVCVQLEPSAQDVADNQLSRRLASSQKMQPCRYTLGS